MWIEKIIDIYYGTKDKETKKSLQLDINKRIIKCFKDPIDVISIQILKSDDIPENKYLCPDRGYLDNDYNDYLNKYFYMAGYPQKEFSHLGRAVSSGKITKIKNCSFEHILDSRAGSSGSPICLRESICVVGIHKSGNEAKHKNKGTFIGVVLEEL